MYNYSSVSREVLEALEKHQSLTLKWNKAINLVSCNTKNDFLGKTYLRFLTTNEVHK